MAQIGRSLPQISYLCKKNMILEELLLILKTFNNARTFTGKIYPRLRYFKNYYLKSYFYPVSIIKDIIHYQKDNKIDDTLFLNYKSAPEDSKYTNVDLKTFQFKLEKDCQTYTTYYKEIINYITSPDTSIKINSCDKTLHALRDDIIAYSEKSLAEFLKEKPNTFNGNMILRIKNLEHTDNQYLCDLQRTEYFNEVRTHLTIDYPFGYNKTIRTMDMGKDKELKPFAESLLTNTIGVSAIWFTRCEPKKHKNDYIHFFLKPRDKGFAVYDGMLGTISSGVKFPAEGYDILSDTLEQYVSKVLLQTFYNKTQYNKYMQENQIPESEIKIIPLAFTRELLRGGLPQFFFAIETPPINDNDIKKFLKQSALYRRIAFKKSFIKNILPCIFSPETMTNLLYTIQYLNKEVDHKDNGIINLNL